MSTKRKKENILSNIKAYTTERTVDFLKSSIFLYDICKKSSSEDSEQILPFTKSKWMPSKIERHLQEITVAINLLHYYL